MSKYAPAQKFNRVAVFWQSPVIPAKPTAPNGRGWQHAALWHILHWDSWVGPPRSAWFRSPSQPTTGPSFTKTRASGTKFTLKTEKEKRASTPYSTLMHSRPFFTWNSVKNIDAYLGKWTSKKLLPKLRSNESSETSFSRWFLGWLMGRSFDSTLCNRVWNCSVFLLFFDAQFLTN